MEMIELLCPAMVSILIRERKNKDMAQRVPEILFRYGIYVIINAFLTITIITYGIGISGVTSDAFCSFSFFIKYTIIALIMAVLVPYAEEIIGKYIRITWTVRAYDEQAKDNMEDSQ